MLLNAMVQKYQVVVLALEYLNNILQRSSRSKLLKRFVVMVLIQKLGKSKDASEDLYFLNT
jgi:hypothetical protein